MSDGRSDDATLEAAGFLQSSTRRWWVAVLVGVLWVVYGLVVMSSTTTSVAAVAGLFAVGLLVGGTVDLVVASLVDEGKWFFALLGVMSIIAGIVALAWPGRTIVVLAAIIGWYLMFNGIFTAVFAVVSRHDDDLWWLGLIVGGVQIAISVWAVSYTGRSVALLLVWVSVLALARGITYIVTGLVGHGADKRLKALLQ